MIYDNIAMNNGVIFLHTVDILEAKMKLAFANLSSSNKMVNASLDAALVVPIAVNGAFACELFMKSMLPNDTRGHKLEELFALLEAGLQEEIKNLTVEKMQKSSAGYGDSNFYNDLMQNSNVFAEWRYFHEGNTNSLGFHFILLFLRSIFDVVNKERQK